MQAHSFRPLCRVASVLCGAVWLLGACGGGGGNSEPAATPIVATADTLSIANGASGQLLANDTLGGAAVTTSSISFSLTTTTLPSGVAVSNGVVSVGADAVPGNVQLAYKICETARPSNCADGTASITIPAPAIVATADSFSLLAGGSADVLANDTLGGTAATAARVLVNASGSLPTGIDLSATGLVSVSASAAPGSYAVGYRICQKVATSNCANGTATVTVPAAGALSGRAIDAATALGVPGVRVAVGNLSTTTDATGAFNLAAVPTGSRVTVLFSADTHAEAASITSVVTGRSSDVQVRMLKVGATVDVPAASGGTVTLAGSQARVVLPAAGLQAADGSLATGSVRVRLTPINPAVDSATMPGDFTTLVSGAARPIESFGALNVRLSDSNGAPLNLRSGQTASIRIPLASRSAIAPATIPLFFFDTSSGRWVQEGTATLAGTAPNQYYEGTVSHFSTWNADQVMNTVRVNMCVVDSTGARVAGATVFSDGVDYSGTSSATSDAAGNVSVAIRSNSQATVTSLSGSLLSNTVRVGPFAVDSTVSTCLALGATGSVVTMKLTWGASPEDLDSHLFAPDGSRVYFSNRGNLVAAPFANLDVDDTSSYGPEVVTITKLMVGTYKYAVNNYDGQATGLFSASGARVELNVPGRPAELFVPPSTGESTTTNWWLLFEFDVDAACNITIRRSNAYAVDRPTSASSSTPRYCTR
jgi:hypothetical protein